MVLLTVRAAPLGPKDTALTLTKPIPVMITLVPPPAGPVFGLMPVTAGPGAGVHVAVTESLFSGSTAIPFVRSEPTTV